MVDEQPLLTMTKSRIVSEMPELNDEMVKFLSER